MSDSVQDADTSAWLAGRRRLPVEDRESFIVLMADSQASEVTDQEMERLFRDPISASARAGIVIKDYAAGSAQGLIRRAMQYPLWQLSFAAFFLNRFWVQPLEANEALDRCGVTHTESGAAILSTYTELKRRFSRTDDKADDLGVTPEDVFVKMFGEGAAPAELTAAIWADHARITNELRRARDELKRHEQFVAGDRRAPEGSNDTRAALFLLAKTEGLFQKPGLGKAAEALHTRLSKKLEEHQESLLAAGRPRSTYELPTPETLQKWIECGSDYLGEDLRGKPGRPKKAISAPN